jgi:hypothetical protein
MSLKFIDLVELIAKLYEEEAFTAIYCVGGKVWIRRDLAEACPAEGIYYAPADWQERVKPIGKYPSWMVRLVAYTTSNAKSLIYRPDKHQPGDWSLDVVR